MTSNTAEVSQLGDAAFSAVVQVEVPLANQCDHLGESRVEVDLPLAVELGRLLELLEPGDVLTVWKLDRLGRSLSHLVATITALGEHGAQFRSMTESIDTTTAQGRLVFHLMAAVAEFERELVRERTANEIAAARAKNKPLGRPSKVSEHQYHLIRQMHEAGQPATVIAKTCGLSRSVVGRVVRGEIPSLAHLEQLVDEHHDLPYIRRKEPQGEHRSSYR